MSKYMICWSPTREELIDSVNAFIEMGWKPQGGIAVGEKFYQAMVRDLAPVPVNTFEG